MDKKLGVLMPFNIFYNALDKFIDHTHRSVIIKAIDNQYLINLMWKFSKYYSW